MSTITPEILFRSGPLSLTPNMLRFRGRRYAIAHIENMVLRRPLFIMACGWAALIAAAALFNADILYGREIAIAAGAAILIALAAWPWGTLYIQSKLLGTNSGAITWRYRDLIQVVDIVEMMPTARGTSGAAPDNDDEDAVTD